MLITMSDHNRRQMFSFLFKSEKAQLKRMRQLGKKVNLFKLKYQYINQQRSQL